MCGLTGIFNQNAPRDVDERLARVTATIYAPNSTIRLGRTSFFDGTFCSSKTSTDKQITLICNP